MSKLIIIVGMPGSGKSHLCIELAKQAGCKRFSDATLTHHDDSKRAGHNCLGEIVARLLRGEDCVIDETHLTDDNFRNEFKRFCKDFLVGVDQHWVFIDIDVLASINSLHHDSTKKGRCELSRFKALNSQRKKYKALPDLSEFSSHEIVQPFKGYSRFQNEHEAITWLESEIDRLEKAK